MVLVVNSCDNLDQFETAQPMLKSGRSPRFWDGVWVVTLMLDFTSDVSFNLVAKMAHIYLKTHKNQYLLHRHPWIYPKAILKCSDCQTGSLVTVFDVDEQYIGTGVYNEHSLYRVRVLSFEEPTSSLEAIVTQKLHQAKQLRLLLNLPNDMTNAYRLCNSEADGLSGLTIDIFHDTCVIASSAYWVETYQQTIMDVTRKLCPNHHLIWRSDHKALKKDGYEPGGVLPVTHQTQVMEMGVKFHIDFSNPQKTGLFLDQRANHHRLASLAQGKKVLDLYTYTGGFALHAAKAGAAKVTAVDSSDAAIELAKKNVQLNGLDNLELIHADARDFIKHAHEYDIVVLDPPKLAPSRKDIERAKNYYRFLHREIFKHMRHNSLLLTCNCSAALNAKQFSELVSTQANLVGRTAKILGIYGPARCHPTLAHFPEGQYLTAVLLSVE